MKNKRVVFASIIFLFTCCNPKEKVKKRPTNITGNSQIEIVINDKIPEIDNFDEFVDSTRFVRLETTPTALVGEIIGLEFADNKFFILDGITKSVLVFDAQGKFLNRIGKPGKGPDEYIYLVSFAIDHTHKMVVLFDQGQSSFLLYDFAGNFKKRIKIDGLYLSYFKPFNDGILIFTNKINYNDLYSDILFWKDNKVKKSYLPFSTTNQHWYSPFNPFYESEGNVCFIDQWNSRILELHKDTLSVKYRFEFGDMQLPLEYTESLDLYLKHKDYFKFMDDVALENYKYLYFRYLSGKSAGIDCLYNKSTGEIFKLKNEYLMNSKLFLFMFPLFAKDNYFVSILESTKAKILSDLPSDLLVEGDLKRAVKDYNISDNPLLVITYMK
jgi:hypothetical protein